MSSISITCSKPTSLPAQYCNTNRSSKQYHNPHTKISCHISPNSSRPSSPVSLGCSLSTGPSPASRFQVLKPKVAAAAAAATATANSAPVIQTKSDDELSISAFMSEVSDLVKIVDSRDIVELQLKQLGCELVIKKKEAVEQPPRSAAPVVMMQSPPHSQSFFPSQLPPPQASAPPSPTPPPSAPTPALPAPAISTSSSHPALKCPMAGTFYRCPAPGEPPFVKVGDKVQKGQVICIIEAMKLMNEIEADQSGTVTEILVEDGKPVSVDLPLFVIAP